MPFAVWSQPFDLFAPHRFLRSTVAPPFGSYGYCAAQQWPDDIRNRNRATSASGKIPSFAQ